MLIETTVVGSYPQPRWLIHRDQPAARRCRACARPKSGGWSRTRTSTRRRTTPPCSRSATWSARASTSSPTARCGARAIPTASPPRWRASTSSIPGPRSTAPAGQTRCRASSARSSRTQRGRGARHGVPAAQHRRGSARSPCPGRSPWRSRRKNEFYRDEEALAMDFAAAVNDEAHELQAAGADVIQLDEPWLRNDPEARQALRGAGDQPRAARHRRRRPWSISASATRRW